MTAAVTHPVALTDTCACGHESRDHTTRHCHRAGCGCVVFRDPNHVAAYREVHDHVATARNVSLPDAVAVVSRRADIAAEVTSIAAAGKTIALGFSTREDADAAADILGLVDDAVTEVSVLIAIGRGWTVRVTGGVA